MSARASGRELRVGLVVVVALASLMVLLGLAAGGPGFLSSRRMIDVDFRDGQGIRSGSGVRIAGIDSGRVESVTLAEVDGVLRARVRLAIPLDLAARLRSDARITIQSSLTGQSRINIISTGKSDQPLEVGKVVGGVETSMFDPILEQVGLGPVERSNISHTIGQVRETVDAVGPKVRNIVASIDATTTDLRETSAAVRPVVETTVSSVGDAARRFAAATPKIEATLAQVVSLTSRVDGLLAENRPNITATIASIKDLSATLKMVVGRDQEKVTFLLDKLKGTVQRADVTLYNTGQLTETTNTMLTKNRVDIDRTISNVKDATDWASKLVQKIFANPFVISPFYKPKPEDIRVQGIFDAMQVFSVGCEKLDDAVKTLEAMQSKPATPQQREEILKIRREVAEVTGRLTEMSTQLTDAIKPQANRPRRGPSAN